MNTHRGGVVTHLYCLALTISVTLGRRGWELSHTHNTHAHTHRHTHTPHAHTTHTHTHHTHAHTHRRAHTHAHTYLHSHTTHLWRMDSSHRVHQLRAVQITMKEQENVDMSHLEATHHSRPQSHTTLVQTSAARYRCVEICV